MLKKIITHPGRAHKDDFLAICLLISRAPAPILRGEPSPEDLADPTLAVIDVGGEHEPARMNFDHHQWSRDRAPTCALSLVLDHLGCYEDAQQFWRWLATTERLERYHRALALYRQRDFAAAYELLEVLQREEPRRMLYTLYRERIEQFRQTPPPPDWDGSFTHTSK